MRAERPAVITGRAVVALASLHAGPDDGYLNTDTLIVVHVPGDGGKASASPSRATPT